LRYVYADGASRAQLPDQPGVVAVAAGEVDDLKPGRVTQHGDEQVVFRDRQHGVLFELLVESTDLVVVGGPVAWVVHPSPPPALGRWSSAAFA
jgi:hypothetical protein